MGLQEEIEQERDRPQVRQAIEDAQNLEGLTLNGSWVYLKHRFEGYSDAVIRRLAQRIARGEELDQRQIDFCRGYAKAIEEIFEAPDKVERDLERAAERAFRRAEEREELADGEEAPYT